VKQTVKAVVTITVEIESGGVWTSDTTMGQIVKQAEDGAKIQLERIFHAAVTSDDKMVCQRPHISNVRMLDVVDIKTQVVSKKE
jgi:hypothetical protein